MATFFKELRRRNVFRVTGLYAVISWLLIQISATISPMMNLPEWAPRFILFALLIGFPIALLLAWAFEMTPEGVKRTEAVKDGESITTQTGHKLDYVIVLGLILVAALMIWQNMRPANTSHHAQQGNIAEASVAVLPFIDLSAKGDQEYFSDGISEEILNVLVSIPKLQVAGRTSSFSFKGKNEDLRKVGATLNVNYVVEGSVRRAGEQLRITAQLIRSKDGFHLWSETYDRELTDIFDIQEDIARKVAEQLAVSLGLAQQKKLVKARTKDLVAYEKYLQARQLFLKRGKQNLEMAALLLVEATARDPEFSPAWDTLASVYVVIGSYQVQQPSDALFKQWFALAEAAARRALAINPDNGSAYAKLGSIYNNNFDWNNSIKAYETAIKLAPENADVFDSYAQSLMEIGYYQRAQLNSQKAVKLDPLVAMYHYTLGRSWLHGGEYNKGLAELNEALRLDPKLPFSYGVLSNYQILIGKTKAALETTMQAIAVGAWPESLKNQVEEISNALDNEVALRDLIGKYGPGLDSAIATILHDPKLLLSVYEKSWNKPYRSSPFVFTTQDLGLLRAEPRWKAQVRKDGILDTWRKHGFPEFCHPVGEDDFECKALSYADE